MIEKEKILKEIEKEFEKLKKETDLQVTLDELDRIFGIKDYIIREGYVSVYFSRQIAYRISDIYNSWAGYLHNLLVPNPQNIINVNESKLFQGDEKNKIYNLMTKAAEIFTKNTLNTIKQDFREDAKLIDYAFKLWNTEFEPKVKDIMEKISKAWRREEK